mmetsp:Transcript_12707/g.37399  ORF Transcript_12707/g.37399 Transcript_12707/m.37399 type:complete len:214 (-) Transcript_12707:490-1131(-)
MGVEVEPVHVLHAAHVIEYDQRVLHLPEGLDNGVLSLTHEPLLRPTARVGRVEGNEGLVLEIGYRVDPELLADGAEALDIKRVRHEPCLAFVLPLSQESIRDVIMDMVAVRLLRQAHVLSLPVQAVAAAIAHVDPSYAPLEEPTHLVPARRQGGDGCLSSPPPTRGLVLMPAVAVAVAGAALFLAPLRKRRRHHHDSRVAVVEDPLLQVRNAR